MGQHGEARNTPKHYRHYGTKRFAFGLIRELLRDWAKATRKYRSLANEQNSSIRHRVDVDMAREEKKYAFGAVLGAKRALHATGAWTDKLENYFERRFDRISKARVTRRPFVELRRAA